MTVPRATLALFARLCVAEASHGVWNGSEQRYKPHASDDAEHLRQLARKADEQTALHLMAKDSLEVGKLIALRGRPGLGAMLTTLRASENPAALCELFANNVERNNNGRGFFERGERPTKEARSQIAAALRWAAERFKTFHVPGKVVDPMGEDMLSGKHETGEHRSVGQLSSKRARGPWRKGARKKSHA